MRRALLLISALVAVAAPAAAADGPADLVRGLGDRSFAEREAAMAGLVRLGDTAIPVLKGAARSDKPEVAWRAAQAIRMIRHRVTPPLHRSVGDAFAGYEALRWTARERLTMDLAAVGGKASVPALAALLTDDSSKAVKRAAAIGLLRMGPEGLLAVERSGAKFLGLPVESAAIRIQIGNGFLEEGKYERAAVEYKRALDVAPKNTIAWYNLACAWARLKRGDEAVNALAKSIECGYNELDWIKKDPDLDNIRTHKGYIKIIEALEKKAAEKPGPTRQ
jgi:HEAT repeat protein